jgi:hypothetical protein
VLVKNKEGASVFGDREKVDEGTSAAGQKAFECCHVVEAILKRKRTALFPSFMLVFL